MPKNKSSASSAEASIRTQFGGLAVSLALGLAFITTWLLSMDGGNAISGAGFALGLSW
jgi:hypothetical protein